MNTLTGLLPPIYASMNVVSRENIGFIPAVTVNSDLAQRAAVGQSIRVPIVGTATSTPTAPSMTIPEGTDQDVAHTDLVITDSESVQVPWPGEDELGINSGPGMTSIFGDQMAEAFRTLVNRVEANLSQNYKGASRAYGTAGTSPLAAGVGDAAQVRKMLRDNGATGDLRLVLNSTAGANVRTNNNLIGANTAGTDATLRQGALLPLAGITLHETQDFSEHEAGTGTGWLVNDATPATIGTTTINVDTGTGTILAGDFITFAGDTNKYIVTGALSGGVLQIAAPGLRKEAADNTAITVGSAYERNLAFSRSAIVLAVRAAAIPSGGDAAIDRTTVTDPVSGLSFDLGVYVGFKKKMIDISIAYGSKTVKPEHTAILLG